MKDSVRIIKTAVFCGVFLLLCWMGMQIVHEFGHVLGALMTGGRVSRVVLDPFTISRSDFAANPSPHVTVWAGPVVGSLLPVLCLSLLAGGSAATRPDGQVRTDGQSQPKTGQEIVMMMQFFAGFCLVGNGAYLLFGGFDGVGDCGVMRQCGTPLPVILGVGGLLTVAGFGVWHRLGRIRSLWEQDHISWRHAALTAGALLLVAGGCHRLFPDV